LLQAGFSESFVILAVAASMLAAAYHMLRDDIEYTDRKRAEIDV
jgi:hypothetical protein